MIILAHSALTNENRSLAPITSLNKLPYLVLSFWTSAYLQQTNVRYEIAVAGIVHKRGIADVQELDLCSDRNAK